MNLLLAGLLGLTSICSQNATEFGEKILATENRIAFENEGGLQKGGVCWWHSRFQRAAWALAIFNPDLPKPSPTEIQNVVSALVHQTSVVVIGGYRNLHDFTAANQTLIQKELNRWQLRDGVINQAWIRGISGRSSLPAPQLKQQLDHIYTEFKSSVDRQEVLWLMLQIKGIVSHASLLAKMEPRLNGGYHLEMVDSNRPQDIVTYDYRAGDTFLTPYMPVDYSNAFKMVPYLGLSRDLHKIEAAVKRYCAGSQEFMKK
jgi:hypothetical protein